MGKNLKGKECGKGIYQRKDGLYSARYYAKDGKRKEKYFETLPEAKNWLADARYEERHNLIVTSPDMTVDKWFTYWIENIVCDLAPNTIRNYKERYKWNIQPVIGAMCIADVKPMHCKAVLNRMETTYAGSTIRQAYITMGTMLKSAVMNDIIAKHPMNGVRYTKPVRAVDDIKYLTVEEQEKFLEAAERSHNYRQYALLLETGLRTAELIGLTWDAIDWKKRTLTVNKSLEYRHSQGYWRAGPPKTAGQAKINALLCEIWFLSTGEQENPQKTVPMTHTYTNCVMKQVLNAFVCTPCDILMPHAPLSAAYSLKCCNSF